MVKQVVAAIIIVLFACSPALGAAVSVKTVKTEREGENLVLKVDLSSRLSPKVFSVDAKGERPRVVVDFMGAAALPRLPSLVKSPSPLARRVRIGRHKNKIRLVIDLVPGRLYRVEQFFRRDMNRFILVLAEQPAS